MVYGREVIVPTKGFSDVVDVTDTVNEVLADSGIQAGIVSITSVGSTASVTTIEYEPALVQDIKNKLEEWVSKEWRSLHSQTWGDDNGFSHVRASLMGPGCALPIATGKLVLGIWQQIVLIDHDNRPRERRIYIQIVGE